MRVLLLGLLTGCNAFFGGGSGGGGDGEDQLVENAGRMCLHAAAPDAFQNPEPQTFTAGQAVTVTVELTRCFSSSCDLDRAMSCSIAPISSGIEITSVASWTRTDDQACTDDCGQLAATCETDPLPAGSHLFTFGGQTLTLDVPSDTLVPPCIEVPE